jgi:hypothetical protein
VQSLDSSASETLFENLPVSIKGVMVLRAVALRNSMRRMMFITTTNLALYFESKAFCMESVEGDESSLEGGRRDKEIPLSAQ